MNAHWKRYHSLYIGTGCLLLAVFVIALQCGCQSNEPLKNLESVGAGAELEIKTSQSSNNVWPWMIAVIAQPVLFLAFLYFSNSWKGKRGL